MSISITLYNFSKKENSTKQPTGGVEVQAVFKNATSKYNPSFILNIENPLNYNYIKYGNIYYYVNDVILLSNNHCEYQCEVDVLSTWKADISEVTAYTRFSSVGYDVGMVDSRLSSNPEVIINVNSKTLFKGLNGGYLVSYVGEHATASPVVGLSESGIKALMTSIQSSAFAEVFKDPTNALNKVLSDTASCITSCKYSPIIPVTGTTTITLAGGYETGITASTVGVKGSNIAVDIPWNFPLGDFRNRSQFTSIYIYLPGYGYIQLNTDDYVGKKEVAVIAYLDGESGTVAYIIGNNTRAECTISTPVQISTTTTGNVLGSVASAGGALLSLSTGNIIGAVGGAFGAILSSMTSNVGSVGSVGSRASWDVDPNTVSVITISHDTNVDPSNLTSNYGRPCNKVKRISTGYNECTNASIKCNAPQYLKDKINSFINGGFYYE